MALNLAEFINGVALANGLSEDDPELKLILSSGDLTKMNIPAKLESIVGINYKDMLTMDAAKNHPDLKKHFFATSMYGVEKDIERLSKDLELTDEDRSQLKQIKGANERLEAFVKLVHERSSKKSPPTDDEKLKKANAEIARLNDQIVKKDEEFAQKENSLKQSYLEKRKEHAMNGLFQNYNYTDALDPEVQRETAQTIFRNDLKKNNYKIVFNEEDDSLRLTTDQDTEVYRNNKSVTLTQYLDGLLAEKKLLKVTPAAPVDGKKKEPLLVNFPSQNGKIDTSLYKQATEEAMQAIGSK